MLGAQFYADPTQCRDSVGHQALRASFVDARLSSICDNNFKTALAGGKRSSETGWTAPNYENVRF